MGARVMRGSSREPVKVSEEYTVIVKIVRTDKIQYPSGEYGEGMSPPIDAETEQVTIASRQPDLARAVDMAISLLQLQHPDGT